MCSTASLLSNFEAAVLIGEVPPTGAAGTGPPTETERHLTATSIHLPRTAVLADLLPATRVRTIALVVGGALLTAAASQLRIPLGFTPVPVTGLTFAALFVGGALGMRRGMAAVGLFWALGALGLPFYAGASGGWDQATGATGGYLLGSVVAAGLIGAVAERGGDRKVVTSVAAMAAANVLLIWVPGTLWLAHVLGTPVFGGATSAFALGIQPFVIGDVLKMVLAGSLLPLGWRMAGSSD